MSKTRKIKHKYLLSFILSILFVLTNSCVERYYLDQEINFNSKVIVDALLTNKSDTQFVKLSYSSSPEKIELIPLTDCDVYVADGKGNIFPFSEDIYIPGNYYGIIDKKNFTKGNSFMLTFETQNGNIYTSSNEQIFQCPDVDSIYYKYEPQPTTNPNIMEYGIQFYLNHSAPENFTKYYKIDVTETWEYHSTFPIKEYFDINNHFHDSPLDFSLYTCYNTKLVDEIFTLSTDGLKYNQYKNFPLHFVNDHTQRLMYGYSLLIEQFSLSEGAYNYWEFLRENNETSGLFSTQPLKIKSNIKCRNNPNEEILGYFGVSIIKSKRIFVKKIPELTFSEVPYCDIIVPVGFLPPRRPLYLATVFDENLQSSKTGYANSDCFDCTLKGGSTEKPDFWPY